MENGDGGIFCRLTGSLSLLLGCSASESSSGCGSVIVPTEMVGRGEESRPRMLSILGVCVAEWQIDVGMAGLTDIE
eukprot:scaffold70094_cov32-Tisochrysis_lutea.AAC.2